MFMMSYSAILIRVYFLSKCLKHNLDVAILGPGRVKILLIA
jgi:hypothetical protein